MKNKARNSAYMKFANRQLILNIIRKNPISRAELARRTGLTRAAISLIADELIGEGIVMETGTGEAEYGRKPVLLDINADCCYAIGLNISRGGCSAGLVNMKGVLVSRIEIDLDKITDAGKALKIIVGDIDRLVRDSKIASEKLIGMGISMPGPLDVFSGTVLNPPNFSMWHGVNIVQQLRKQFNFDVFLENNSTALALAEKNYGKGSEFDNFMLMVVDTGIGSGIIIDNKLYRGTGGFGGEVGHTSIDINGRKCSCGNAGCLELYASIPAVLKDARLHDAGISAWNEIVDRAEAGDDFCIKVVEKEARYLSGGVVNAMNILELEAVVLTGIINYKPGMLLDRIREIVGSTVITRDIHKIQICNSDLTDNAEIISAAAIAIEKYFNREMES